MKKTIALLMALCMVLSLAACGAAPAPAEPAATEAPTAEPTVEPTPEPTPEPKTETDPDAIPYEMLYDESKFVIGLEYEGLDMTGLDYANVEYGSEGYGNADVGGGCSITFATYRNGRTGAVRNMDLQVSAYTSYEFVVRPGENTKNTVWGLAYTGMDSKGFRDILATGMTPEQYVSIPFTATDSMSFGYNEAGERASLYCALLMRADERDEDGNYLYTCSGTYPGAPIRCCTQSLPILFGAECLTIEDVLAYVGAVDEDYNRIYPDVEPTLDVYTFNIENEYMSNHWLEVCAMEDSTGHHGVLEFIDNYAIWHDDIDYSFNFFLQDEYLKNEDGSYRETGGAGIGRCEAVVPYLDKIHTVSDHLDLMDGIRYSYLTYYNEDAGYVGCNWEGDPVDWRSEYTHLDVFHAYQTYHDVLGLNTAEADAKYPLWAHYRNTETGVIERVDSYEYWLANQDHLQSLYTLEYVMAPENYAELMNVIRWSGLFFCGLTLKEVSSTHAGWETYFRVVADPMNFSVTRWFNEDINTADTVCWESLIGD